MEKKPRVLRGESQWRDLVKAQETSGLSIASFCEREKLPKSCFWQWRKRFCDAGSALPTRAGTGKDLLSSFVELGTALGSRRQEVEAVFRRIELEIPGGLTLRIE